MKYRSGKIETNYFKERIIYVCLVLRNADFAITSVWSKPVYTQLDTVAVGYRYEQHYFWVVYNRGLLSTSKRGGSGQTAFTTDRYNAFPFSPKREQNLNWCSLSICGT